MKKKIVKGLTCGTFDLFHAGYIILFEECKKVCDYLIVAVQVESEKENPIQGIMERLILLKYCTLVDEIHVYWTEAELLELLQNLDYDIRILDIKWKNKTFTGHTLSGMLEKCYFNERIHTFSQINLRKKIYEAEKQKYDN